MPAYIIAFVRFQNIESYNREYLEPASAIVAKHGGKALIVSENVKVLEGDIPAGRLVVVEFPSLADAEAFYADPDYQPLKEIRQKYTTSDSAVLENAFDSRAA